MRHLFVIVIAAGCLSTNALAQDLPSPALVGAGQSTQTVELVKQAVTLTVDAGGAIDTREGAGNGNLSVELNGLGVGVGSARPPAGPGNEGGAADGTSGSGNIEAASAAPTAPDDFGDSISTARDDAECAAEPGVPLSVQEILGIGAGSQVLLAPTCHPATLTADQRRAVAENTALASLVAGNGVTVDALVSITTLRDVVVLTYRLAR